MLKGLFALGRHPGHDKELITLPHLLLLNFVVGFDKEMLPYLVELDHKEDQNKNFYNEHLQSEHLELISKRNVDQHKDSCNYDWQDASYYVN